MSKERLLFPDDTEFKSAAAFLRTFRNTEEFREDMNNFYMHFVLSGLGGTVYRRQLHFLRYNRHQRTEANKLTRLMTREVQRNHFGWSKDDSIVASLLGQYNSMRNYVALNDPYVKDSSGKVYPGFLLR